MMGPMHDLLTRQPDFDTAVPGHVHPPCPADLFRHRFQSAALYCVRKGFSIEECFGFVWEETSESIKLSDAEQRQLYGELLDWARTWFK